MVMGAEYTFENIPGRFAVMQTTLESEIVRGQEGDRVVRHRLIFQRTQALENALTSGSIITITHRLHRLTNAWAVVTENEQYIVESDTDVQFIGDEINLGLIRKDQR
jgi:hypothetical protein